MVSPQTVFTYPFHNALPGNLVFISSQTISFLKEINLILELCFCQQQNASENVCENFSFKSICLPFYKENINFQTKN